MSWLTAPLAVRRRAVCCNEGRALGGGFLALAKHDARNEEALNALADWAIHQIEAHGEQGVGFPSCGVCPAFGGPAPRGLDGLEWEMEGRVHRVVHALDMELQQSLDNEE